MVPEAGGSVTLFIADYYNGRVRAVGPDGIIRDVSDGGGDAFGAPTRVAYARDARGWLYVADSSRDRLVALNIRASRRAWCRRSPRAGAGAADGGHDAR